MTLSVIVAAQAFEALMLLCFGFSWPVAIAKTWRSRRTEGKSLGFLSLIFVGYLAGLVAKILAASTANQPLEWTAWLYVANGLMVGVEIVLYLRFTPRKADQPAP